MSSAAWLLLIFVAVVLLVLYRLWTEAELPAPWTRWSRRRKHESNSVRFNYGVYDTIGRRPYMEDRYVIAGPVEQAAFGPGWVYTPADAEAEAKAKAAAAAAARAAAGGSGASAGANPSSVPLMTLASTLPLKVEGAAIDHTGRPTASGGSPVAQRLLALPGLGFNGTSLYGVFDGHTGARAAEFCVKRIPALVASDLAAGMHPIRALTRAFTRTDDEFISHGYTDGTTATVALIVGNELYVGNAGDSRALLILKDGTVEAMSEDHKPNRPDETARIKQLGGNVLFHGVWRVSGILAVSRSIGDRELKPYVTARPEIRVAQLNPGEDAAIVLATDGLWDVMTSQDAAKIVLMHPGDPQRAAKRLVQEATRRASADNITALVIDLTSPPLGASANFAPVGAARAAAAGGGVSAAAAAGAAAAVPKPAPAGEASASTTSSRSNVVAAGSGTAATASTAGAGESVNSGAVSTKSSSVEAPAAPAQAAADAPSEAPAAPLASPKPGKLVSVLCPRTPAAGEAPREAPQSPVTATTPATSSRGAPRATPGGSAAGATPTPTATAVLPTSPSPERVVAGAAEPAAFALPAKVEADGSVGDASRHTFSFPVDSDDSDE